MEQPVTFIGIDLGWGPNSPSVCAALRGTGTGASVLEVGLKRENAELIQFVADLAGDGPAIVAIDAPLVVPNVTGMRPADREVSRAFHSYHAGAYPANRQLLAPGGAVRGEVLVDALRSYGFGLVDAIEPQQPGRYVVEIYPHPAMVAIFGLDRILRYKYKRRRARDERNAEWRRYQSSLCGLSIADPPLRGQEEWCSRDVDHLRGKGLDDYEDATDALFCAYVALYGYRWGAERCRTFGDLEHGYIFSPVPEGLRGPGKGVLP